MKICTVEGCSNARKAWGLCNTHYYAERIVRMKSAGRLCSVEGCGRSEYAKDLCRGHYARKNRGVNVNQPLKPVVSATTFVRCRIPKEAAAKLEAEAARLSVSPSELHSIFLLRALGFQR